MPDSLKAKTLKSLRARIAGSGKARLAGVCPAGLHRQKGPEQGLCLTKGHVHEVLPDRPGHGAAIGFVTRTLAAFQAQDNRPVMWVMTGGDRAEDGRLYAPGLAQAGLDPSRLIIVTPRRPKEVLWVLEQALGAGALAGVAAWVGDLALTPSRRLALAAQRTSTPLLLLRPWQAEGATASETRWRISPLPSGHDPFDAQAPGQVRWRIELERARATRPGIWEVACDDAEDALDLGAQAGHRTLAPRTQPERRAASA